MLWISLSLSLSLSVPFSLSLSVGIYFSHTNRSTLSLAPFCVSLLISFSFTHLYSLSFIISTTSHTFFVSFSQSLSLSFRSSLARPFYLSPVPPAGNWKPAKTKNCRKLPRKSSLVILLHFIGNFFEQNWTVYGSNCGTFGKAVVSNNDRSTVRIQIIGISLKNIKFMYLNCWKDENKSKQTGILGCKNFNKIQCSIKTLFFSLSICLIRIGCMVVGIFPPQSEGRRFQFRLGPQNTSMVNWEIYGLTTTMI